VNCCLCSNYAYIRRENSNIRKFSSKWCWLIWLFYFSFNFVNLYVCVWLNCAYLCTMLKYRDRKYGSTLSILGSPSGPSPFESKALATAMQLHFPGSHIVQIRAHSKMACLLSTSFTVPLCVNKVTLWTSPFHFQLSVNYMIMFRIYLYNFSLLSTGSSWIRLCS
jgi:hypothetical protein